MPRFVKGEWKFSHNELWNLDISFSKILVAGLEQFKTQYTESKTGGVPTSVLKDLYGPDLIESYTEEQLQKASVEFIQRIDLIIYALKDQDNSFKEAGLEVNLTTFKLDKGDKELFNKLSEQHEKKVKQGLELFVKHYRDLWF